MSVGKSVGYALELARLSIIDRGRGDYLEEYRIEFQSWLLVSGKPGVGYWITGTTNTGVKEEISVSVNDEVTEAIVWVPNGPGYRRPVRTAGAPAVLTRYE